MRWAHHNYLDIEDDYHPMDSSGAPGMGLPYYETRVWQVQTKLSTGGQGGFLANGRPPFNNQQPRDIWLTEGARRMFGYYALRENDPQLRDRGEARQEQAAKIANNFAQMRHPAMTPVLWTQYLVNDDSTAGDPDTCALREVWSPGGTAPAHRRERAPAAALTGSPPAWPAA